jgi:hypothetical protein
MASQATKISTATAPQATRVATLLHLETGHVLAAVTSLDVKPTVADLTGTALRVRLPGTSGFVDVPVALLTATTVAVTDEVLDRPLSFQLSPGNPLRELGEPLVNDPGPAFPIGKAAVVVWQVGNEALTATGTIGTGTGIDALPGDRPSSANSLLVAVSGFAPRLKSAPIAES